MRITVTAVALCMSLVGLSIADDVHASIKRPTNIPAQLLAPALQSLAKDRNFQIIYVSEEIGARRTAGAVGEYTPEEALKKLLSDTGLSYKYLDQKTVTIIPTAQVPLSANAQESGHSAPDSLRLAQETQTGPAPGVSPEDNKNSEVASPTKSPQLEEVMVTGSRISQSGRDGAQDVKTYTREQIEHSGQTTVSDFLSNLPGVSLKSSEVFQGTLGATTVQLRGLPVGTTLVLIDGHRVETSGTQYASNFFDLSNIPMAAVERIDVLADGASAIYGSDAIAGVVNVILRSDISGLEVTSRYGTASHYDEKQYTATLGQGFERGHISLVGSYEDRGTLLGSNRALTADNDYTKYGGADNNYPICMPGNVFFPNGYSFNGGAPVQHAAAPITSSGMPSIQDFAPNAGTLRGCPIYSADTSLIAPMERTGLLLSGSYEVSDAVSLYTELMYSRVQQRRLNSDSGLFGIDGFQLNTLGANNPYNPFGETVGIAVKIPNSPSGDITDTKFLRPLFGARGSLGSHWSWEASLLLSQDFTVDHTTALSYNEGAIQGALDSSDPATAFNPFTNGQQIAPAILKTFFSDGLVKFRGRGRNLNAFLRGDLFSLPAGEVQAVIGGEYQKDDVWFNYLDYPEQYLPVPAEATRSRRSSAAFTEIRVPLLSSGDQLRPGDQLALTAAARYDQFSDFGHTTNPQVALEWHPISTLLVRSSYAQSFKAPSLNDLYSPVVLSPNNIVFDPVKNMDVPISVFNGGNPNLKPETGRSETLGLVYSNPEIPGLRFSATRWYIEEKQTILDLQVQDILNNEANFGSRVVRDAAGNIVTVDASAVNFGSINVAGFDYEVRYKRPAAFGTWTTSLEVAQTTKYDTNLIPNAPTVDRVSKAVDGGWAPRWKGTATLGWERETFSGTLTGRYVGSYQDYDLTRTIGNFWLFDLNLHYQFGQHLPVGPTLQHLYLEAGAVNLLNTLPQFSNANNGQIGYDPSQGDIRGRFLYVTLGLKL